MTEHADCFLCRGLDDAVARSDDGRAVVMPFRDPFFEAHQDAAFVDPETWAAIGTLVPGAIERAEAAPGVEKCYLLALGDVDKGHLHFHVVPKGHRDVSLGKYVFGPDGWNAHRQGGA